MAYLYGIWGCFIAFAASGLYRLIFVKRMRRELESQAGAQSSETIDEKADLINLLKLHKARFPNSRTRSLSNVLTVVQMVAAGAGVVLMVAAQFQPHSL